MLKLTNYLILVLISAAFAAYHNEALALCGDSRSDISISFKKTKPTALYKAIKDQDFMGAAMLLKADLVKILGTDFSLPKIITDYQKSFNPALFMSKEIRIYPGAFKLAAQIGIMHTKDIPGAWIITLAHELVHAWQEEHTNLLKSPNQEAREAIFEGHATFVQSLIAKKYGLKKINNKGIISFANPDYYMALGIDKKDALKLAHAHKLSRINGCKLFLYAAKKTHTKFTQQDLLQKTPEMGIPQKYISNPKKYEHDIFFLLNNSI
jgi:hypothetical protein